MSRLSSIETLAVQISAEVDAQTGAVSPPLHLSTTFEHAPDGSLHHGFLYQRYTNPTVQLLEKALAALDDGKAALHFATGMAAGSALMQCLPAGGHVLLADDTYFAFRKIAATFFSRWGLTFDLVDMTDLSLVRAAVRPNTCCLWVETPSNPLIKVSPLQALASVARAHKALLVVDATFATPVLLQPLSLGADVVLHSTTKYFGGHSDAMGGALVFARPEAGFAQSDTDQRQPFEPVVSNERRLLDNVYEVRKLLGGSASPFASWLTLRGIRTLPLRVRRQSETATQLAAELAGHAKVRVVHHPSLRSHAGHETARTEMAHFGGMLSFEVHGTDRSAFDVIARLKRFICATSLGGVESLVEHRRSIEGPTSSTPETLIRLSVGLENVDDLWSDLLQALR
jgi:cystathionine gamma-synthase